MNFPIEKIVVFLKNYKLWVIFAFILLLIYLIVKSPRIYSSFEMELDQVDTIKVDSSNISDTLLIKDSL